MNSFAITSVLARVTDPEDPVEDPTEEGTVDTPLGETVDQAVTVTFDVVNVVLATLVGIVIGIIVAVLLGAIAQMIARRHPIVEPSIGPTRRPFQLTLALVGGWIAFGIRTEVGAGEVEPEWRTPIIHAGLILMILAATWFVASIVVGFEAAVVKHVERTGTKRAKRIQTQFQIVRRVLVAVIWTLGIAGVLITFPTARAAGASILASAGIISVIAGLAAQSTLGNVFAGLQVAFSDSLRVDDVVIVNGEYCAVEEITLTYVVVRVWDGRRIIVPSSKLTTEAFENWTRRDPLMMGKVYFDLDWRVPVDAMRSEMNRALESTELWDGRTAVLQVDSAENGRVRIALLVSAKDSPTLTDLRNFIREHMVKWIQKSVPRALPYERHLYATIDDLTKAISEYPDPETFVDQEEEPIPPRPKRAPQSTDLEETVVLPTNYLPFRKPITERSPLELSEDELSATPITAGVSTSQVRPGHEASIFSGSPEAEELAKAFAGPGEDAIAEREQRASQRNAVDGDETLDENQEETAGSIDSDENANPDDTEQKQPGTPAAATVTSAGPAKASANFTDETTEQEPVSDPAAEAEEQAPDEEDEKK
ncbi:MAG: mechanosensitive ion channel domain-containing protein [Flaviflexus sp.]|uniref:mechanosensitive ion channel domain-containing protein n=1 Tax=Flaviflexus sp. TaxID=1969482 RepID=UPI003F8F5CB1